MKRIIRLTESDLARIVRRVISEGFAQNTVLSFESVTGYKSGLFPELQYGKNGSGWSFMFSGTKTLGNLMNMRDGDFSTVNSDFDATNLQQRSAFNVSIIPPFNTRVEVEKGVRNVVNDGAKDPFKIKSGGTYKNKQGKTVTWGRPAFTAGSEMVDAICKVLNILS